MSPHAELCILMLLVALHSVCHVSTNRIDAGSVIEIAEELAPGTVIIDNIYRRLQLNEPASQSSPYAAIANPASAGVQNLIIRPHRFDGSLQLAVRDGVRGPDREELCNVGQRAGAHHQGPVSKCDLTLVIVHGNRQNPSYAKVTLRITDINDNAPSFPKGDQFELRIPEDPVGSPLEEQGQFFSTLARPRTTQNKYPLPLAFDPDLNENGVKFYRLTTSAGHEIDNSVIVLTNQNEADAADSSEVHSPALRVIGLLDRERTSDYWFNLLAVDGGVPQKTGTLTVHVVVTDLNDNAPKFRTPIYHLPTFFASRADYTSLPNDLKNEILRIPESTGVGVDLVTLSAEDPDEGVNAQLSYHIKEPLSDEPDGRTIQSLQLVRINDVVKLRVSRPLDADVMHGTFWSDNERDLHGNLIYVTVEVTDAGLPPLSSSVLLPILIENVNDNAPEISVQFTNPVQLSTSRMVHGNQSRLAGSLRENLLGPNTIAHVTVNDADRLVPYMQTHGRYPQIRESVRCELNDSRFSLEQVPSMSSQPSSDVVFGTSFSQSSYFYRLSALTAFDREESEWVRILVTCMDQVTNGQSGYGFGQANQYRHGTQLTGSAIITLQILDVNDNTPKCLTETYRFSTFETPSLPGVYLAGTTTSNDHTTIGQVKARDLDAEMNGLVRYKLLTNPNSAFKVNERDGTVIRVGHLDREKESQVTLSVEVYDQGNPSLSSTCSILVDIMDVNDHPPYWVTSILNDDALSTKWVKSEDGVFYFSVPEDTEVGQVIGMLTAIDVDGMAHNELDTVPPTERSVKPIVGEGKLLYQLELVDEASMFSINRRTGELRLNRKLDRETRAHYEVRAFVVDNADSMTSPETGRSWITTQANRFTATATVFITVLDVNDNAPQFESPLPGQEFHIDPSSPLATPGTTLFTAVAHDSDSGENATVRYALEGQGYGLVEIDSSTGVCYIRESVHKHSLAKLVALSGGQVFTSDRDKHATTQVDLIPESHSQSELRSLTLNLIIVAYDMGIPKSLNSSRRVRLVWDAQTAQAFQSVYPYQGTLKGLYVAQNGKLTRTEHLLIPLMIGAFLLLIVVCLILFGLARRRRRIKHQVNSPRSPSSESLQRTNWCTACFHPSLVNGRLGSAAKGGPRGPEPLDGAQKHKEFESNAANVQCVNLPGRPNSVCSRPFLPDCIPQSEPNRISTPQHNQIGHLLINPPRLKSNWGTQSRYAGSSLSRALSDESLLNAAKEHEIGYTALCAFPSAQPEDRMTWTHRLPPTYHKETNRSPDAYGDIDLMPPAIMTAPRLARPIAYRPQTLNTQRTAIYNPHSGFTPATAAASLVYPTFHSTAYGLSPTEPSEMHYEAFDSDQTKDPERAGWKPSIRLTSHYTENTFV